MLGWQEIILILAILLLIVGPEKIPKISRDLGNALREFRRASEGFSEAIVSSPVPGREGENKKAITDIAKKLGMNIEGKTEEQILKEITTFIDRGEKVESAPTQKNDVSEVKN